MGTPRNKKSNYESKYFEKKTNSNDDFEAFAKKKVIRIINSHPKWLDLNLDSKRR